MTKKKKNGNSKEYRTFQFRIKKDHSLFAYCDAICFGAKNMYNTSLYVIRQVMSVFRKMKNSQPAHLGELLCTACANAALLEGNAVRYAKVKEKAMKEYQKSLEAGTAWNPKEGSLVWFDPLTENHYMDYDKLDAIFKQQKQADYLYLPAHTAQYAIKDAVHDVENWSSAFNDWKVNPGKYKAMPKMPGYKDKTGRARAVISNDSGKFVIKDGVQYLQLPKLQGEKKVHLVKMDSFKAPRDSSLMETRIIPKGSFYNLELVFSVGKTESLEEQESVRILAVDPGEKNFATITSNFGEAPRIIKGGAISALNRQWNEDMDYCLSRLYEGKDMKKHKGLTSALIQSLTTNRNSRIKDWMHKASRALVNYALSVKADTIVIGKNEEQKQEIHMGRKNNRKFVQIPFNLFNAMVKYKAEEAGIKVILQEESYTSKSSFLDEDFIPVFRAENKEKHSFSGKRTTRGTYKSKEKIQINADVNGSANILRKAFPEMKITDTWKKGILMPVRLLSW